MVVTPRAIGKSYKTFPNFQIAFEFGLFGCKSFVCVAVRWTSWLWWKYKIGNWFAGCTDHANLLILSLCSSWKGTLPLKLTEWIFSFVRASVFPFHWYHQGGDVLLFCTYSTSHSCKESIKCVIISLFVFLTVLNSTRTEAVFVFIVSISPDLSMHPMLTKNICWVNKWENKWWYESQWAYSGFKFLIMPFEGIKRASGPIAYPPAVLPIPLFILPTLGPHRAHRGFLGGSLCSLSTHH